MTTTKAAEIRANLLLNTAKRMWADKQGIATITEHLRVEYSASYQEMSNAVANMLRGK